MSGPDRAQTETVGVVLLTGVVVITADLFGVVVLGDVETERGTTSEIDVEVGPTAYTVTHAGGDSVPVDEVQVGVQGTGDTTVALSALAAVDTDGDGLFEPGETFSRYHDSTSTLRVLVIHDGSSTVLHDERTDLPDGDGRLTWDTQRTETARQRRRGSSASGTVTIRTGESNSATQQGQVELSASGGSTRTAGRPRLITPATATMGPTRVT